MLAQLWWFPSVATVSIESVRNLSCGCFYARIGGAGTPTAPVRGTAWRIAPIPTHRSRRVAMCSRSRRNRTGSGDDVDIEAANCALSRETRTSSCLVMASCATGAGRRRKFARMWRSRPRCCGNRSTKGYPMPRYSHPDDIETFQDACKATFQNADNAFAFMLRKVRRCR